MEYESNYVLGQVNPKTSWEYWLYKTISRVLKCHMVAMIQVSHFMPTHGERGANRVHEVMCYALRGPSTHHLPHLVYSPGRTWNNLSLWYVCGLLQTLTSDTLRLLTSMSHYGAPPQCNLRILTWLNPMEGPWRGGSECNIRFVPHSLVSPKLPQECGEWGQGL